MKFKKFISNKLTLTLESVKRALAKVGLRARKNRVIVPSSSHVPYQRVWNGSDSTFPSGFDPKEDIMKRKLLIDGDAGRDDKRISELMKNFVRWCMDSNQTAEERKLAYQRIIAQLRNCEVSMEKSHQMLIMNRREMKNYEDLYSRIERSLNDAQSKLSAAKAELAAAKRVRRNRQEYDAIAQVIESHPSRTDTAEKLAKLEQEINQLQDLKKDLNEKLEKRKKQFEILLGAAQDLHQVFKFDNTNSPLTAALGDQEEIDLMGEDAHGVIDLEDENETLGLVEDIDEPSSSSGRRTSGRERSHKKRRSDEKRPNASSTLDDEPQAMEVA